MLLVAGCALQPTEDAAYKEVRARLDQARADQDVRRHADVLLRDSERTLLEASTAAERVQLRHLVYLAGKKLDITRAVTDRRLAEERLKALKAESEGRRLAESARLAREIEQERQSGARDRPAPHDPIAAVLSRFDPRETTQGTVLTLPDVLFDIGRSQLGEGADEDLEPLVAYLRRHPRQRIVIGGHTDNIGDHEYNLSLSLARANSVKELLMDAGVDPEQVSTLGHGDSYPVASNASPAGRQRNRRVEILIERPQ